MRSLMIFGVAAATVLSGCDEVCVPGDLEDEVTARKVQTNGVRLNGTRLNGVRLNGTRLNGTRLNGDDGSAEYVDLVSVHAKGTKPVSEEAGIFTFVRDINSIKSNLVKPTLFIAKIPLNPEFMYSRNAGYKVDFK